MTLMIGSIHTKKVLLNDLSNMFMFVNIEEANRDASRAHHSWSFPLLSDWCWLLLDALDGIRLGWHG